ncbi:MAG: 3'(2'),5'-bisphosphate nucleotidase CysQ [Pirellulaceae bacterium]|nr:3'(2'),5'-bisphosphate nucleotidase CysQ [Pirellulaceae bacterium]
MPRRTTHRSLLELLDAAQAIAHAAGRAALGFYGQSGQVATKADNSPLTQADRASHRLILEALVQLTPDVPVVSEESAESAAISRAAAQWRWLVDPLDGTKEFIKQTGEFTVNIALVQHERPVLGVVHVPVSGASYLGVCAGDAGDQIGAWRQLAGSTREPIRTRRAKPDSLTVVASRDHAGPDVEALLQRLAGASVTSMGSSLKFCLVAEGAADFYPRFVPTMQWDTAAAHAVLVAAGGHLTRRDGTPLSYPREPLRNPPIMAFGDASIDWPGMVNE